MSDEFATDDSSWMLVENWEDFSQLTAEGEAKVMVEYARKLTIKHLLFNINPHYLDIRLNG